MHKISQNLWTHVDDTRTFVESNRILPGSESFRLEGIVLQINHRKEYQISDIAGHSFTSTLKKCLPHTPESRNLLFQQNVQGTVFFNS